MSVRKMLVGLLLLLALAVVGSALAQSDFATPTWTLDSGGGTLAAPSYTLSVTAGQPDAGVMQGGAFALYGGLWGRAVSGETQREAAVYLPAVLAGAAARAHTASAAVKTPKLWLPLMTSR
jgi:hypothetical protein